MRHVYLVALLAVLSVAAPARAAEPGAQAPASLSQGKTLFEGIEAPECGGVMHFEARRRLRQLPAIGQRHQQFNISGFEHVCNVANVICV